MRQSQHYTLAQLPAVYCAIIIILLLKKTLHGLRPLGCWPVWCIGNPFFVYLCFKRKTFNPLIPLHISFFDIIPTFFSSSITHVTLPTFSTPHLTLLSLHLLLQREGVLEVWQPEVDSGTRISQVHLAWLDGLRPAQHGALRQQWQPWGPPASPGWRGHYGDHQRCPHDSQCYCCGDPLHSVTVHPSSGLHNLSV